MEWIEREAPQALVDGLVSAGHDPLFARLLALRGIGAADAGGYLNPTLSGLAAPDELPGVAAAAETILDSASRGERAVVFGDYDCDGVCATAILVSALAAVSRPGAEPRAFLPERLSEGYGMTAASVARMLRENPGVRLIVTVDNGINSVGEVAALTERGIRVVVTDHHLPGDELPAADALVNPKVAAPAALGGLCGAGVAFLLANAVVNGGRARGMYSGPSVGGPLLVLAGLATVTDVMPLSGQNRIIVAEALRRFRALAPVGLKELFARASRSVAPALSVKDFGFVLGPRINAAGRMASGMESLDLVLCADRERARELARRVDLRNVERKSVEQAMLVEALSKVEPGAAAQVIDIPDGHPGVAGIVAARIMERAGGDSAPVPVCVVVDGHGSARAPDGYNVRDAFASAAEALDRFGGHAAAGGCSVKEGKVDLFRGLFREACAAQAAGMRGGAAAVRAAALDAWVAPRDLSLEFAERLHSLEPFGEGNPEPVFGMRGVRLAEVRPLGADGRHLSVAFRDKAVPRAIWWNRGDMVEALRSRSADAFDVVFTVETSDYLGRHAELRLVDASPAATVQADAARLSAL